MCVYVCVCVCVLVCTDSKFLCSVRNAELVQALLKMQRMQSKSYTHSRSYKYIIIIIISTVAPIIHNSHDLM